MKDLELRVRVPVASILDAMADEVAREVERQIVAFKSISPAPVSRQSRPVPATIEEAVDIVVDAVTRVEQSQFTRDEPASLAALHKACLALRTARKRTVQG